MLQYHSRHCVTLYHNRGSHSHRKLVRSREISSQRDDVWKQLSWLYQTVPSDQTAPSDQLPRQTNCEVTNCCSLGSFTINVLPLFSSDSTTIFPPCRFTASLQSSRPRPELSSCAVPWRFGRSSGSNSLFRISSEIPIPWSLKRIETDSSPS